MISRHFGDISENINYDLDLLGTILSLTGRTTLSRPDSESALPTAAPHPPPPLLPPTLVLRSEFYYPGSLISRSAVCGSGWGRGRPILVFIILMTILVTQICRHIKRRADSDPAGGFKEIKMDLAGCCWRN